VLQKVLGYSAMYVKYNKKCFILDVIDCLDLNMENKSNGWQKYMREIKIIPVTELEGTSI
jgi:hypothetical protein